jgi:hypothetical protein
MPSVSTTPLLSDDATPELIDEEDIGQLLLEEEDDYPEDIVAGLVIPVSCCTWNVHHERLYPAFQGGYGTPWRGNPLPARVAQHCESCMTGDGLIQRQWKELIQALHGPIVKYQTRRAYLMTGVSLTVLGAAPFLVTWMLHSSSTRGVSTVLLLTLAALLSFYQLLKCITQEPLQLSIKDIVEQHTPVWKEHVRIKLKLMQPKASCCGCGSQDMVLLFQKYVPVSERQAQIAFV